MFEIVYNGDTWRLFSFMKHSTLVRIYISLLSLVALLLITTPYLIREGFSFFEEEFTELLLLALLLVVGYSIHYLYQRELVHRGEVLTDLTRHVGKLNRQVSALDLILKELRKLPETDNELKKTFLREANVLLNVLSNSWVYLRAIEEQTQRSMTESFVIRGGQEVSVPSISNKMLLSGDTHTGNCSIISTLGKQYPVHVFCILPIQKLEESQRVAAEAVVNNLALLYIITMFSKERDNGSIG